MKLISCIAGLFILIRSCQLAQSAKPQMSAKELEEFNLTTVEIIEKYGYPSETHTTETEDGYILQLHRIPHGKNSTKLGFPLLVAHGLFFDSSLYLLYGEKSLGFFLADEGYDVWLINFRGNHYTRTHKNLSSHDSKFWDFTFHEHGVYDLPACINYICNITKNEDILYLGFSMGTTSFFILGSERPEYQKYIRGAVLLGPVAILKHSTVTAQIIPLPITKLAKQFIKPHSILHKFQDSATLQEIIKSGCNSTMIFRYFCSVGIFLGSGYDTKEFDQRIVPNLLTHMSSTSTKLLLHYFQLLKSDEFQQYDYGALKNLVIYKSPSPPRYHLESITIPISLLIGQNDVFANPEDTLETTKRLRSVKSVYVAPQRSFNHYDYFFGKHVMETVYPEVAKQLKDFLKGDVTPQQNSSAGMQINKISIKQKLSVI